MEFRDHEGTITPAGRAVVIGGATVLSACMVGGTFLSRSFNNEERPEAHAHATATSFTEEGESGLGDMITPEPTETTEEPTPEPTETPSETPATTAPAKKKDHRRNTIPANPTAATDPRVPERRLLGADTCAAYSTANPGPIVTKEVGGIKVMSVIVDTRERGDCEPGTYAGATAYAGTSTGSKKVDLGVSMVSSGETILNGSVLPVGEIACGQAVSRVSEDGRTSTSGEWLRVYANGRWVYIPNADAGFVRTSTLHDKGGVKQTGDC